MLGLARTTPSPNATWILMAGDSAHHPAMLRPSAHVPLPPALEPLVPPALQACARNAPFLALPKKGGSVHHDHEQAARTLEVVRALDARDDVWVLVSHDGSLDVPDSGVRWLPETANAWAQEGLKEKTRWRWLEKGNPAYRW